MAGLDQIAGWASETTAAQKTPPADRPSLPLYAAGFVITLCGILAANAALTEPDYVWMAETLLVSGAGFLFSYGSRRLGFAPRILDYGLAGAALILLAGAATGQISVDQFLPAGADRSDLRLMAKVVWGGTLWAWALRSDNRVAAATVPAMAVLGMAATIDVNTPVLVCFGVFILCVIFLLIHQNYLQNRSRAAGTFRGLPDASPGRLLLAQFAQAGLCGLLVLLLGMLVIVPAMAVFSHLSLSQAIRHLAAGQAGPVPGSATQHFSDDDNFQIGTGEAWSSSPDVVMRVTPSDGKPHYWRGRTYDVYTGAGWQSSLENDRADVSPGSAETGDRAGFSLVAYALRPGLTPGDLSRPAGSPSLPAPLEARFEVRGETSQFYYADSPREIVFGSMRDSSGVRALRDGRLGLVDGREVRFRYRVVSSPPPDLSDPGVSDRLREAGTTYPRKVRDLYLTQSADVQLEDLEFYQQCVADALQSLPPNERNPLDETAALRDWVSRRCVYTLTPPPLPDDTDHVHAFLGDARRGYCDMFASSLAVLCRTAGIPARLAVGFAPGDPDGDPDDFGPSTAVTFNLRAEDKHAWTEVYFPGTGWIAFDATAGSTTDGTVPTASGGKKTSWLSRLRLSLGSDWQLVYPLIGLILAIGAYVVKTEVYDPWRRKRFLNRPARAARRLPLRGLSHPYHRLTHALARLGLPRRQSETPGEYAARVLPLLPPLEREWNVSLSPKLVTDLTAAFTEACYADPDTLVSSVQPWNSRVAEFEAATRRVYWQRFWGRLTRLPRRSASPGIARH